MSLPTWLGDAARAALPEGLRRREFLDLVVLIALVPACKRREDAPGPEPTPAPAAPTPATALPAAASRTLAAACGRILPADGAFPGATEAGVITFIDRQLAIAPLSRIAPAVIALAHALDDAALARKASDFASLAPAMQDEILEALSLGKLGSKLPEAALFRILHGFVLEGFLSDPNHGGNRDQVAWRAIGFVEPSLRVVGGNGHEHH